MAYLCFIILPDACFSYDAPCDLAFDPTFACCRGVREFGPAPPKRRASEARCKTPEVNRGSVSPVSCATGARRWPSSNQKRSWPGVGPAFDRSGLGRCGAANLVISREVRDLIRQGGLIQSIQQGLGRVRSSWRSPATHPCRRESCKTPL